MPTKLMKRDEWFSLLSRNSRTGDCNRDEKGPKSASTFTLSWGRGPG
jgi:hypothetical protein